MRRPRQFRPLDPAPLEQRVVLSALSSLFAHSAPPKYSSESVQTTTPTTDGPVIGNAGNFQGLDIAQSIAAGNPVYEQLTTTYSQLLNKTTNFSTQNETRLIVPDKANHTITTTSTINLRGGGYESVQDIEVLNGAGQVTGHYITTTLPNGGVQYETELDAVEGAKTLEKGTIYLPGGSQETFTGTVTVSGNKSTTDVSTTDPGGRVTRVVTVVTVKNELRSSSTIATTYPDGTFTNSTSNTTILRMNPPNTMTA